MVPSGWGQTRGAWTAIAQMMMGMMNEDPDLATVGVLR